MRKLIFILPILATLGCGKDQEDINNKRIVDSLNLTEKAFLGSNLAKLKLKEMELKNQLLLVQKEIKDAEANPDPAQEMLDNLGDTAKLRESLEKMMNEQTNH
jgi:hypothetical protein